MVTISGQLGMEQDILKVFHRISATDNHYLLLLKALQLYTQNEAPHKRAASKLVGFYVQYNGWFRYCSAEELQGLFW